MTFAYDDLRYDKMATELETKDHILRNKVLIEINEDFRQSYSIMLALKSDIPT
eukprot:CAMPEP_0201282280 /NCGR_PEP_ID=MMETSP1317-20130820/5228_1 /ASSEMBLY_ACC=CAM_ASM_000770 /TAXON_ID=187299 /ORGANISM="Undescribed Undescribed, Strain Undescribed" /LENGTH=52 /DNA_ID=CAMNT_0047594471 /DNA_START=75 /DNA_END=233 /DNA_ORIENTATION=+